MYPVDSCRWLLATTAPTFRTMQLDLSFASSACSIKYSSQPGLLGVNGQGRGGAYILL